MIELFELDTEAMKVAARSLSLLDENMKRLEADMAKAEGFDFTHSRDAAKLATANSALLREIRSFEKKKRKELDGMTHEELSDAVISVFKLLPPEHQRAVLEKLK